jgi:hypothetical protein
MRNPHYKSYSGLLVNIKNLCVIYDFFLSLPAAYLHYIYLECVVSLWLYVCRFKSLFLILYLFEKNAELTSLLAWDCPPLPLCYLPLIETICLSVVVGRIFHQLIWVHIFGCLNLKIFIHFSRTWNDGTYVTRV